MILDLFFLWFSNWFENQKNQYLTIDFFVFWPKKEYWLYSISDSQGRLHSIKGPFQLVLGGVLTNPPRSRTRKTEFKLIERLPDVLRGQFKFLRDEGPIYRTLALTAGTSSTGAWRKVFASIEYPRLVFKLSPATEDLSYTTEETRAFRQIPDYTAQFIQEFHSWSPIGLRMNHIDPSSRFTSTSLYVKGLFLIVKQTSQVWTLRKSHIAWHWPSRWSPREDSGWKIVDGVTGASASGTEGLCHCY